MPIKADRRTFLGGIGAAAITPFSVGATKGAAAAEPAARGDVQERLFELGTVTYNIAKDWNIETLIAFCQKHGLKAVELRTTHKHGVEPTLSSQERADVRKRFESSSVRLLSLGTTCEFHSPDPAVVKKNVETAREFIQLAHDVGALGIKVRPNGLNLDRNIPAEVTLKQIGTALQECGEAGEGLGVEVWLEVHGRQTAQPANIRSIMDFCQHPNVGITWNSNPEDVTNGSIHESFELLKKDIRCVHINELWTDYPYRELFTALRSMGYDRYTLIEIAGNPEADRLLNYYRKLWLELNRPT